VNQPLLLDTCAVIWIAEDAPLTNEAVEAMDESHDTDRPVCVSPITAWEIGVFAARERWVSTLPPVQWFERFLALPGIHLTDMGPSLLISSSFLPGPIHKDPADRILVATAREQALTLVTRDRHLLDYGDRGYICAIAC